jgi:outer membrane murein-binding lipoprotein Lpp
MSVTSRITLTSVISVLLMAGCSNQPPAKSASTVTTTRTTSTPVSSTSSTPTTAPRKVHRAPASNTAAAASENLPNQTGIAACDDYLSSYLACHRAANIFAPGQLQSRYQAMRTSLLRDSQDPDIRPQLGARCNALASQLRDALHGKSCDANAAPASTSP